MDMNLEKAREIYSLWEKGCQPGNDERCKEYADTDEGWLGVCFEAQGFLAGHSSRDAEVLELRSRVAAYRQVAIDEVRAQHEDGTLRIRGVRTPEEVVEQLATALLSQTEPKTDMTQGIGGKD